jgi:hypothetical protein
MTKNQPEQGPLSDEERKVYLRYVASPKGTPEEIAAAQAWWNDDNILMSMELNL